MKSTGLLVFYLIVLGIIFSAYGFLAGLLALILSTISFVTIGITLKERYENADNRENDETH